MLNFLLAIIIDAYTTVKENIQAYPARSRPLCTRARSALMWRGVPQDCKIEDNFVVDAKLFVTNWTLRQAGPSMHAC
jgi:hypothetical protein